MDPSTKPVPSSTQNSLAIRQATFLLAVLIAVLVASGLQPALAETVPMKRYHGTFVVPVQINGQMTLNFTLDSGAAEVSIPADVISTLTRAGTIATTDFLDPGVYQLADGRQTQSQRVRIRSLRVGSVELRDVIASVAPQGGPLLLGQSFLAQLGSWTQDNKRHLLVINESPADGSTASPAARSDGTVQASDWLSFGTSKDGTASLYADQSSVRIEDGIRQVWFKMVYAPHTQRGFGDHANKWMNFMLYRDAFNCEQETGRTEEATVYYDDGTNYNAPGVFPARWESARPDTSFSNAMEIICMVGKKRASRAATTEQ